MRKTIILLAIAAATVAQAWTNTVWLRWDRATNTLIGASITNHQGYLIEAFTAQDGPIYNWSVTSGVATSASVTVTSGAPLVYFTVRTRANGGRYSAQSLPAYWPDPLIPVPPGGVVVTGVWDGASLTVTGAQYTGSIISTRPNKWRVKELGNRTYTVTASAASASGVRLAGKVTP